MKNNIIDIVKNSKVTHPIAVSATKGNRYWYDFLKVNEDYKSVLSEREYNNFLNKSQLDCQIKRAHYIQFASEVTIIDYIIRHYSGFKYEPKYNDKKNPECSFEYINRTINIEVKSPDLFKRMEQEDTEDIKLYVADRFSDKNSYIQMRKFIENHIRDDKTVKTIERLDNKLKDYLISAHKKFPISNSHNFNILVVALDIIKDMDEWYYYLFGENGAFTRNTYITDVYSNVDAVLLTNVQHGHMADDIDLNTNCWSLENYISLLFLDPRKEKDNELVDYYKKYALNLFGGRTISFLCFLDELDQVNVERNKIIEKLYLNDNQNEVLLQDYYIKDKIIGLRVISEWFEKFELKSKE